MNIKFYFPAVLLLLALALCGCQDGIENPITEDPIVEASGPTVFTATIERGDATKTTLGAPSGGDRMVKWSSDDSLRIGGARYDISEIISADSTSATFTGSGAEKTAGEDYYEAFYPASIYNETGSTVTLTLPAEQVYTAPSAAEGNRVVISHLPMYARGERTSLTFHNLCAVLNFQLKGTEKVTKVVVKSASMKLNGSFDLVTDGTGYKASMTGTPTTDAEKEVLLDCGTSGVQLDATTPTEFCVAIPAQDYPMGDLTVTFYSGPDAIGTMGNPDNEIAAQLNTIYRIEKTLKKLTLSVTYDGVTLTSDGTPVVSPDIITLSDYDTFVFSDPFTVTANAFYKITVTDETGDELYSGGSSTTGSSTTERPRIPANFTYTLPASNFQEKPFTVSMSGTRVYFSPGNLQYRASATTWRFADNQLDYVGDATTLAPTIKYGTVYQDGVKSYNGKKARDYEGWIDLFGWGTTGINYRSLSTDEYQPWMAYPDGTCSNYGPVYNDSDLAASSLSVLGQSDWGVNDILSGGTTIPGGTYRTLTSAEWQWLINHTPYLRAQIPSSGTRTLTLTIALRDESSYAVRYTITQPRGPLYGLILFPDEFMDDHADLVSSYTDRIGPEGTEREQWTEVTNWPALEAAGCVFLPTSTPFGGAEYWSSTVEGINHASGGLVFSAGTLGSSMSPRWFLKFVRLVKDVTP